MPVFTSARSSEIIVFSPTRKLVSPKMKGSASALRPPPLCTTQHCYSDCRIRWIPCSCSLSWHGAELQKGFCPVCFSSLDRAEASKQPLIFVSQHSQVLSDILQEKKKKVKTSKLFLSTCPRNILVLY